MTPTPEQEAIIASALNGENIVVKAYAGTGKTSTNEMVAHQPKIAAKGGMALAFNVRIKKELEARLPKTFKVLTINGLGHRAIAKSIGGVTLDQDKIFNLVKAQELRGDDFSDTKTLVEKARQAGIIPKGRPGKGLVPDLEEAWADLADAEEIDHSLIPHARQILAKSHALAMKGTIDFTDQIYISSLVFGSFPKEDFVITDEQQDFSPQNLIMLEKTAKGQLMVVGDPNQAIYAWRGADHNSMTNVRKLRNDWTDLTLSVTFRCPSSVVARQTHIEGFRAGPNNLVGRVEFPDGWFPTPASAVICRNNKPLLKLGFALLRNRVPVNLVGGDIGKQLKRLYNKIDKDHVLSRSQAIAKLETLLSTEEAGDRVDRIESLITVLEAHESIDAALEWLTTTRRDAVTLTTGHRAKGLEWDQVYFLDSNLIPSRYAITDAQLQQERNLRYVIETRTKDRLTFVRSEGFLPGALHARDTPSAYA